MEIDSIVDHFIQHANPKYEVVLNKLDLNFRWPEPSQNWQKKILTLSRLNQTNLCARTVLVASGPTDAELEEIYKWCAYVKSNLLDPGTADLYLFLVYSDPIPELDVCLQVESNELYCRKYVLRPQERIEDLLNRSFLSEPSSVATGGELTEPLKQVLFETSASFPWFDASEIEHWRSILLAEGSGSELAQLLYQRSTNNE